MAMWNILTIAAIVLGPIFAIQIQKRIETWKEERGRKLSIFKSLMATRGTPLNPKHVEALNMIDLEFSGEDPQEKAVLDSWKLYRDHLNDAPRNYEDPNYQTKLETWGVKSNECLVDLLYAMSRALGYTFDKVQLKRGAYTPQGHMDLEFELTLLRRGFLDIFYEKKSVPVRIMP